MRARYKVGDIVKFTFAGSFDRGEIVEVKKKEKEISYIIKDAKYTYNINQDDIITKF